MMKQSTLIERLGMTTPLVQAPMAGTSTPMMAAAVSNAGALGSISVGAVRAEAARQMIRETKSLTSRPFNVNVFCHAPPVRDATVEREWLNALSPQFKEFDSSPPAKLEAIYSTFQTDDSMLTMLLEERPSVVSFHFGIPSMQKIDALKDAGVILFATATNLSEAGQIAQSGIDATVAQGFEAGGHRGVFDPDAPDETLGTFALVKSLASRFDLPIIAAGGIMDGAGIAGMLRLGAAAAQLGTAFIGCPESSADAGFRAALFSDASRHTSMVRAISGRPARCLQNGFTRLDAALRGMKIPAYPVAYDAGKALNAAARTKNDFSFGAQWAGEAAPLARALPAGELVARLDAELKSASAKP